MSQPQKLDKKLCLDKSKQKSFVLKGKRKSSSMQSFTEKVGFNGGRGMVSFAGLIARNVGIKDPTLKLSLYVQYFSVVFFLYINKYIY